MKCCIMILFFSTSFISVFGQTECGTKAPPEAEYDRALANMRTLAGRQFETQKFIRVFIVDFLSNDGTDSSWGKNEISTEFQVAKDLLRPFNICLVLEGVEYVKNTSLQNIDDSKEAQLKAASYHGNALNMYLHTTLTSGATSLNGVAYKIKGLTLSLSQGAITQRSMAHEVGHCFGLLHTFETAYGLECPDGSNSTSAGDKIADTRATPDADVYLSNNTNDECGYTGNLAINCNGANRLYNPEITNLMSYGKRTCRSIFSGSQNGLMHSTLASPDFFIANLFLINSQFIDNTDITYDDVRISAGTMHIGNNSATINTRLGFTAKQRFLSETLVKITAGTRITATSNRTKVVIKATPVCEESIGSSF